MSNVLTLLPFLMLISELGRRGIFFAYSRRMHPNCAQSRDLEKSEFPLRGTLCILAINTLCFGVLLFSGSRLISYFVFRVEDPLASLSLPWILSSFTHFDLPHFFWNMFCLYLIGPRTEAALGFRGVINLYGWGAIGCILLFWLTSASNTIGFGASGAVSSLIVFYLLSYRRLHFRSQNSDAGVPSIFLLFYFLGINVLGIVFPDSGPEQVGYWGHLGGSVAGSLTWLLYKEPTFLGRIFQRCFYQFPKVLLLGVVATSLFQVQASVRENLRPDHEQMGFLRKLIESGEVEYMQRLARTLKIPPEHRHGNPFTAYGRDEVLDLSKRIGMEKEDPRYRFWMRVYDSTEPNFSHPSAKETSQILRTPASERLLFGGITEQGMEVKVTRSLLYVGNQSFPFRVRTYSSTFVIEAESYVIILDRTERNQLKGTFNGVSLEGWKQFVLGDSYESILEKISSR